MRRAALLFVVLYMGVGLAGASEKKVAPNPRMKDAVLFRRRCSACHDPARVSHRSASRDGWREIVWRMQRMPQSGITPDEARQIVDYLAGKRAGALARRRAGATSRRARRTRKIETRFLAVLNTARVRDQRARLGRRIFDVMVRGDIVALTHADKKYELRGQETAVIDSWRVGKTTYEVHLFVVQRKPTLRIGLGLKKR